MKSQERGRCVFPLWDDHNTKAGFIIRPLRGSIINDDYALREPIRFFPATYRLPLGLGAGLLRETTGAAVGWLAVFPRVGTATCELL